MSASDAVSFANAASTLAWDIDERPPRAPAAAAAPGEDPPATAAAAEGAAVEEVEKPELDPEVEVDPEEAAPVEAAQRCSARCSCRSASSAAALGRVADVPRIVSSSSGSCVDGTGGMLMHVSGVLTGFCLPRPLHGKRDVAASIA